MQKPTQERPIMTLAELALRTEFRQDWERGLGVSFSTSEEARRHLRKYEDTIAGWGHSFKTPKVLITAADGNQWEIVARPNPNPPDISPLQGVTPSRLEEDPDYLLVAEQRLGMPLVNAIMEMREQPGIKAIVSWSTQKQVILTRHCSQIPIGEDLEDCLKYSRWDYWANRQQLNDFLDRCRQELRQDGSNSIVSPEYLTIDPTTGGDPILIVGRYRMIDCGPLGFYQMGENISFDSVPSEEFAAVQ